MIIQGKPPFTWSVQTDGNDLLVLNTPATAFGGANDAGDDGQTSSGVSTKLHPFLMGVALPMDGFHVHSLLGSPIPRMPFGVHSDGTDNPQGAHVIVQDVTTGKSSLPVPVIDLGPSGQTQHGIDLTVALAKEFDPYATANNFLRRVNYRVLGGAKYIQNV